jgi:hypothetical protein
MAPLSGLQENEPTSRDHPPYTFALLKTCRQIHDEASTLPFELNTFCIHIMGDIWAWAKEELLGARLRRIRTLRVYPVFVSFLTEQDSWRLSLSKLSELTQPKVIEVVPLFGFTHLRGKKLEIVTGRVGETIEKAMGSEVEVKLTRVDRLTPSTR